MQTSQPRRAPADGHGAPVEDYAVEGRDALDDVVRLSGDLQENLGRVIRGKPEALRLALVAVLSGGHLLIEDVPGVGKTLLAKALARSVGGSFRRIQATP